MNAPLESELEELIADFDHEERLFLVEKLGRWTRQLLLSLGEEDEQIRMIKNDQELAKLKLKWTAAQRRRVAHGYTLMAIELASDAYSMVDPVAAKALARPARRPRSWRN